MTKASDSQRGAMHLLFTQMAEQLNDAGYDQKAVLEQKQLPAPNTQESIKEIWKAIQFAMYPTEGKVSTTTLTTTQVHNVYEVFNRFFAENFGISIPFPSHEKPMI